MKSLAKIRVAFLEHMGADQIVEMLFGLRAAGNVTPGDNQRTFVVEVYRAGRLQGLIDELVKWDLHGFVRWSQLEE